MGSEMPLQVDQIGPLIRTIRGQKVILDFDLARIFGVPTHRFNEAIKRNRERFPDDFLFRLTAEELKSLTSQSAILKPSVNLSQIAIGSLKYRDPRHLPYAFTENGAIMAANVLNSPEAVRMGIRAGVSRLCSTQKGEDISSQCFWLAEDCPANSVTRHFQNAANDSPSPGGEGRDEGERPNHSSSYPIRMESLPQFLPHPCGFAPWRLGVKSV
jgi:hypothetical protein